MSKLYLRPTTIRHANTIVRQYHRHNVPVRHARFAIAAYADGMLQGVAIVGNPIARQLSDGLTAEVLRTCALPDAQKGTCSFLLAACRRIWRAMGGQRIVTYTLETESGDSLRGAGWNHTATVKSEPGWSRPSRPRTNQPITSQRKIRWEATL